jgi:hypothetical protein
MRPKIELSLPSLGARQPGMDAARRKLSAQLAPDLLTAAGAIFAVAPQIAGKPHHQSEDRP